MTITVKDKTQQLIVPSQLQRQAGFMAGDQLEFKASRGVITIAAKLAATADECTLEQRRTIDAELSKGLADVKAGRVHGPFASAKEASAYIEKAVSAKTGPKAKKRPAR